MVNHYQVENCYWHLKEKSNPSREIGKIIKVASRDESGAALKGLQNEVSDFMIDQKKHKEIIIDGKSTFVPDIKRLNTFVNKNKDSLNRNIW